MLTYEEFNILYKLMKEPNISRNNMELELELPTEKIDSLIFLLKKIGYLDNNCHLTDNGVTALEPYKVKNAIILAAGFASRCAPLSYEKPKGLFKIKGEILIERQIQQLLNKGIHEIYVVVGYKKELFYYLEQKFGVHIIVNSEYAERNNLSSVYAARDFFGNSYICYSDNYLNINGYESYVYNSYFAGMYSTQYTDEYAMKFDETGLIKQYYQGDANCWYQMGEMYFDRATAQSFMALIKKEYNYPSIYDMKIDDFYIRHLSDINIYIKQYPKNAFLEFDTIADIKEFDNYFIQNMGDNIITTICNSLCCKDDDIVNIQQIKRGLTNTIFSFECRGKKYIYRHPGAGTGKIINRVHEIEAQKKAKEVGLDPSLVACDTSKGWKICHYIENVPFEYSDPNDIEKGVELIRKMHTGKTQKLGWNFNMLERAKKIQEEISQDYYDVYSHFGELRSKITTLYDLVGKDGIEFEMCHNDVCANNILLGKDGVYLIDWEYAGDNDPAADIASFIINYDFNEAQCDNILRLYFGRELSYNERRHYYAYIAISAYFYFSWAIYMESTGHNLGEFSYLWFSYAQSFGSKALKMYEEK